MNDELNKRLIEALDSMTKWTGEQVPLAAQEVIAWEFWSNLIWAGLCFAAAVICYRLVRRLWGDAEHVLDTDPVIIVPAFVLVLAVVGVCVSATSAIKCKVAPRVVVIEAVRGYSR